MSLKVSFLSSNYEAKNIDNVSNQNKKSNNSDLKKFTEYSLMTATSLFGLYYFVKHHNLKNTLKQSEKLVKNSQSQEIYTPHYSPSNHSNSVNVHTESNATTVQRPKWNAVTTNYKSKSETKSKKPLKKEIPAREQSLQDVIPSSKIKEISSEIKIYMQRSGIDEKNNKINPESLDEIMTNIIGKDNVKERSFTPSAGMVKGRVKEYTAPNGRIYVLETHIQNDRYITRLCLTHRDRDLRAYLHPDGTFRINSYVNEPSHFQTTAKGKRWMENSPFLSGNK